MFNTIRDSEASVFTSVTFTHLSATTSFADAKIIFPGDGESVFMYTESLSTLNKHASRLAAC